MIGPFKNEFHFLSNFHESPLIYDGIFYPTVEHAFQASKSMDFDIRTQIARAKEPKDAKRLGRQVKLRLNWETIKIFIMKDLVFKKFMIPDLRFKLMQTGNEELVELNWWGDTFWGVDDKTNEGENYLGRILMEVRQEIRNIGKSFL